MEMTETGARNLNNARIAVLEHPRPDKFTMDDIIHPCGTPGCVWGCYLLRTDLHGMTVKRFEDLLDIPIAIDPGDDESLRALAHFSISELEGQEIFGGYGCGKARTPQQAADYIAAFLVRKGFGHCVTDRLSTEPVEVVASAPASDVGFVRPVKQREGAIHQ